jgi:hypothetical protein
MHIHCYGDMFTNLLPSNGRLHSTALTPLFQLSGIISQYRMFHPLKNAQCTLIHCVTRIGLLFRAQEAVCFSRIGPVDTCVCVRAE